VKGRCRSPRSKRIIREANEEQQDLVNQSMCAGREIDRA
jgi:hypothetical protein